MTRRTSATRGGAFTATALGFVGVVLVSGWAAATGHATILLAALGLLAMCALALTQRGAFIGICLLAAMDGLPFIDTSRAVASKITVEEVAVIVLVLVSTGWILS